jgi:NAD(P)-dependent dehydrogenase (short-subunit alcohol dehydrogenase family)
MELHSQKIVILGGTSGIGLATAQLAAAEGATVVVASSSPGRLDAALARLPVSAEGYALDVRREEEIRDLFERLGRFDHLAYTAGESLPLGPIAATNLETARRALEIRFWGAYAAVKHAAPRLRQGGSIVLTSGIASARPQAPGPSPRAFAAPSRHSRGRSPWSSRRSASTPSRPVSFAATSGAT